MFLLPPKSARTWNLTDLSYTTFTKNSKMNFHYGTVMAANAPEGDLLVEIILPLAGVEPEGKVDIHQDYFSNGLEF
jgi:hypothetical protein